MWTCRALGLTATLREGLTTPLYMGTPSQRTASTEACTAQPPLAEGEACCGGDPHPQLLHPLAFADDRNLGSRLHGATG